MNNSNLFILAFIMFLNLVPGFSHAASCKESLGTEPVYYNDSEIVKKLKDLKVEVRLVDSSKVQMTAKANGLEYSSSYDEMGLKVITLQFLRLEFEGRSYDIAREGAASLDFAKAVCHRLGLELQTDIDAEGRESFPRVYYTPRLNSSGIVEILSVKQSARDTVPKFKGQLALDQYVLSNITCKRTL